MIVTATHAGPVEGHSSIHCFILRQIDSLLFLIVSSTTEPSLLLTIFLIQFLNLALLQTSEVDLIIQAKQCINITIVYSTFTIPP